MLKLKFFATVAALVFASVAWRIDPASRPYIDAAMLALLAWVAFRLGIRLDDWLRRVAARSARGTAPRR